MKYIQFDSEEEYITDFLNLSKRLYKEDNTENEKELRKILEGIHPICKYLKLYKFLIYDDNNHVAGRFAITIYPNDENAYIGFFECVDNSDVAYFLFNTAKQFAKNNNLKKIVGPVNASFWIKYRLKINMFDRMPYTGEPYNKEYYYKMFLDNGYKVIEHYVSSIYGNVNNYENQKYSDGYERFIKEGYKIESPDMKNYDKYLKELYRLLTDLYSDFPIYKHINETDFIEMFKSYKTIMNPEMIKFAYFNNKMVGFYISIPNYNNLVYNINLTNLIKILRLKKKPVGYIMLFMGVDKNHKGLGRALIYSIVQELKKTQLPSIGALARDGKITQKYAEELISERYEYVLMEQKING